MLRGPLLGVKGWVVRCENVGSSSKSSISYKKSEARSTSHPPVLAPHNYGSAPGNGLFFFSAYLALDEVEG